MAHGPLEKLTQINTKQHVDFLLYQCVEGTCFFANLLKENEQFTRVRLKSHIAVSFSETNTAAATHQVFTSKPSAKKLDPFCYCTFSIIRRLHAKGAFALMWHQIACCDIINAYVACKVSWQIVFVKLIGRKLAWKLNFTQNFFFRIVVLIFLEGASRSQKICLADPSLRTTVIQHLYMELLRSKNPRYMYANDVALTASANTFKETEKTLTEDMSKI